jgi:hypothetical protein
MNILQVIGLTVIMMLKLELNKLKIILFLILLITTILLYRNNVERNECIEVLNGLNFVHDLDGSPIYNNVLKSEKNSYFSFKFKGYNSLIYYLLVEEEKTYELYDFYQFGGWNKEVLSKNKGIKIFEKLKNLYKIDSGVQNMPNSSCGAVGYKNSDGYFSKLIKGNEPLANQIIQEIWDSRSNVFNDENHLIKSQYLERKELSNDWFFELNVK